MPSYRNKPERVWKRLVRWCGFGHIRRQKKPVGRMQLRESQNTQANAASQSESQRGTQRVTPSSAGDTEPARVAPELAHLNAKGKPHGPRMAFFRREVIEEEPPRGHTPLLSDRKIYAKRTVTGRPHRISNSSDSECDDDEDRPVANFLPRGYKLQNSDSRDHLRIVRKSAMSPLNGCDQAPSNQARRTPAPLAKPLHGTQSSIDEVPTMPPLPGQQFPSAHSFLG